MGVGQLYPLGYRPTPLLLGLPRDLVVLGYAQRGNWPPQRSGGGHTSIASHSHCRCSDASYGGRCPVGQRPGPTKVEGWCLPDGWRLPRPWKLPGPHRGAGESRGWPDSRERRLGPGQERNTRKWNAPWIRHGRRAEGAGPISNSMGVSPCTATECIDWPETPGRAETPEGAESNTGKGCRAASPGWLWWPVKAVEPMPMDTSPVPSDP